MVKVAPGKFRMKFEPILTAMSTDTSLTVPRWSVLVVLALLMALAVLACEPNTRKAEEAFNRGMAAQQADDHSEAIDEFTEAIKQDPDVASYYLSRGISYGSGGNDRLALDDFTRAIDRGSQPDRRLHETRDLI